MSVELRIMVKDEERKLTKDFNIYDRVTLSDSDPVISRCLKETLEEFKGEPEDIQVKATMVLR